MKPNAFTDDPVLFSPALGPMKFTIDPELLNPVRAPNKFTLDGVPVCSLDTPTINRKGLFCMVTETLLMALSPTRADAVTVVILAVGAAKFPPTATLLFVVTLSESVVVPDTRSIVADKLVVVVADRVLTPDTPRLFWTVALETVRSPLILAAFETVRDEIVVIPAAAEMFPTTVRLFWIVAAESVRSPLMLAAFKTVRDEIVVDPPEIVPDTTRLV